MKTKRLCALLVAGLLSLAPAVTLTSCGGGDGNNNSGGGGSHYSDDSSSVNSQLTNLNGRVLVASDGEENIVINFQSGNKFTGVMQFGTEGSTAFTGSYDNPQVQGSTSASTNLKMRYEGESYVWKLEYSLQNGKLSVTAFIDEDGDDFKTLGFNYYFSK